MPQPNKIPLAFAASGDKNVIPESTETTGLASWREGFPAITSAPFSEGGIAPKRADFNGIFNALSLATVWQQQGGFYEYDATTDYEVGNVVEYNNDLYKCITANGPSSTVKAPTDTTVWSKIMTAADAAALYLPLSGGTLTGAITTKDIFLNSATIRNKTNTASSAIYGGGDWGDGALIQAFGKAEASYPGAFSFRADDGSASKTFLGKTDGTLTWDGKSIVNNGAFNKMFFSQTSGSYTAPYTGVYRITLKGGGGGGGGANTAGYFGGGGGGEGGTIRFYETLVKGQSYPYVIGAGGAAGSNTASATSPAGSSGGITSFNNAYTVRGGVGGGNPYGASIGGTGGSLNGTPTDAVVEIIVGQSGADGINGRTGWAQAGAKGGGRAGTSQGGIDSVLGSGGDGGGGFGTNAGYAPKAGANGYILIEYAG